MKRKRDEIQYDFVIDDEGEIEFIKNTENPEFIKKSGYPGYVFFPFMTIIGSITLIAGLIIGMIIQFQFDRYKPEESTKALVIGCIASYDITNPYYTDIFNSYYKGSSIAESVVSCLNKINIEGYDGSDYKTVRNEKVSLILVGCLGNSISKSNIENDDDKQKIFNCLTDNNLRFRIIGVKNELTPNPEVYIPPAY